MKRYLILFLLITAVSGCRKGQESTEDEQSDKIIITRSSSEYSDASLNRSSEKSDPFDLKSIILKGDSVEITVAYPGGCRFHSFEIIWNETFSDTEPPQTGLIILHDANGDMCEAYITDTLSFCVCDLADDLSLDTVYVNVLNGWTPVDSTSSGGWYPCDTTSYDDGNYGVVFQESDSCLVKVTASQVICGTGLYNNLWFALEDSISAGIEGYYFRKYLQPIAIDESLAGFVPVQGKKYIVGARIGKDHDYLNVPVCLAYSGPSVPVKIICIKEIN
ncbi:MAG: hypothetical protein MUC93_13415 [Bacteroidales bacterium]|jgi:hypothetical protein|nr:hypothetical protein [Bacteroidales bacterium]